jgi:hypothetical protein
MNADRREGAVAAEAGPTDGAEVWLRGNPRPAIVALAATAILAAVFVAAAAVARPPRWAAILAAAACSAGLGAAAVFVWAAARPRLLRRGATLEVRLAPLRVHRVPLELVECVFPGSLPLAADTGESAGRRVNTLVLRVAERATAWRSRPVAAAWGTWEDGSIVFDGRWCEPLSPALAREISTRLVEARRMLTTVPP